MPNSIEFHRIPAMAAGNHKLSMDEYKQLSELLRKAEQDGRLGEAMVFSGLAEKVAPALTRYQQNLTGIPGGNNGPFTLNLQSMVGEWLRWTSKWAYSSTEICYSKGKGSSGNYDSSSSVLIFRCNKFDFLVCEWSWGIGQWFWGVGSDFWAGGHAWIGA